MKLNHTMLFIDRTEDVRDRIARSKYIPESEMARFDEIREQIKNRYRKQFNMRDDTCLKSIVRLVKLLAL